MNAINGGNAIPSEGTLARGVRGHTGNSSRPPLWLTSDSAGVRLAVPLASPPQRPRAELANPAGPQAANTEAVALNPSPPVVSVDTIPLAPMAPFCRRHFRLSGLLIASCVARHGVAECAASCILSESQFVRHRRKDTGDAFLLLCALQSRPFGGMVQDLGLMVNKRLQEFSCRLAVQDQVSWMAFSPEHSATRRKWPRTHPHL
jgi:hypothetical protein